MGSSKTGKVAAKSKWWEVMVDLFPETGLPGYWKTLAENSDQWASEVTVSRFWKEAEICLPKWRTGFHAEFKGDL